MIRKAALVLFFVVVIVGAVVVIAQDPSTVHLVSAVSAEDQRFVEYAAAVSDSPMTVGDRYDVLVNGDRVYPAMLDAIQSASRRVNLLTYIYDKGEIPSRFTQALVDARQRGREVNVVLDSFGASIERDDVKRMEQAGCFVGRFHPFRWYALQEASYRNHRKILVVDGRIAFTGGIGIADHWAGDAQDPKHWRDTQLRIEGPAVRYLEAAFYAGLAESGEPVVPRIGVDDGAGPHPVAGRARSVIVASSPTGGAGGVKRLFMLSIAAARRTIDITTPYFLTDDSTHWALDDARHRGVHIRVLVESDRTDAKPVKAASRADYEHLLQEGIEIYEYQPTMMHAKAMVVDGRWSIVGSANFDNRSLDMNDELNIGVDDPDLARVLAEVFEKDLRVSRQLTLDTWRQRSAFERANEQFWSIFSELF
jgi:cardiolipin synthase A/B